MNTYPYDTAAIRSLLRAAFTAADLRRFCHDRPVFRFILSKFGPAFSFEDMIETVIEQCEKQALFPDLLAAIREHNPRQYERYCDQFLAIGGRQRVVNLRPLDMRHTFKDRHREIQALRDYLADDRVRLVSVVGRGGMGKTALVSHVLAELEEGLLTIPGKQERLTIDGILYLGARTTGLGLDRISADVGRMLGEPASSRLVNRWKYGEASPAARVQYLLEAMRDGLYVILLDNLEDYQTEEGEIADEGLRLFIEHCIMQPGGARLVITSRQEAHLPAAALPWARIIPLREGLPDDDATALLHDLDPQGELGLRGAPQEALLHATQLVQGIPRALELLAGILDRDSTASLSRLLADKRLFGDQVVEELVAEGYTSLPDDEQRVMGALAVCNRPVEEKTIIFLLQPWFASLDVRACLRRLVSSCFVRATRSTGEYSLHPLDREYAYHRLPDGDEAGALNRRNLELRAADYYASIRKPESEWKTIDDLVPHLAEFEHRVQAGRYDGAGQVLFLIGSKLLTWGYYARLVDMHQCLLGRLTDPGLQAYNLGDMGLACQVLGQMKRAVELFQEALLIVRQIGERPSEGVWLGDLGNVYRELGQYDQAIESLEQALIIARETGDRRFEEIWLGDLGRIYRNLGCIDQAIKCYAESLDIARELGSRRLEGIQLGNLGLAYRDVGKFEQAQELYEQALSIAREIGDRRTEGINLGTLGSIFRGLGQAEHAIDLHQKSLAIFVEIGDRRYQGIEYSKLARAYHTLGKIDKVIALREQALAIFRDIGDLRMQSYELLGLGRAFLVDGHLAKAEAYYTEALAIDVPDTNYIAALSLGITLLSQGNPAAKDLFAEAVRRCEVILGKTPNLYSPHYIMATGLMGSTICDSRWAHKENRADLLASILDEYQAGLDLWAAPGVIQDTLDDLELIRAAGVEGLEPIFALLQAHAGKEVSVT